MSQKLGKAVIYGVEGTIAGYVALWDSQTINHKFTVKEQQDGDGNDNALQATNEIMEVQCDFRPSGSGLADAKAKAVFMAPLSVVAISGITAGPQAAVGDVHRGYNDNWIYVGPGTLTFKPGDVATQSFTLRKYVNVAQNQLMTTAPSA